MSREKGGELCVSCIYFLVLICLISDFASLIYNQESRNPIANDTTALDSIYSTDDSLKQYNNSIF